MPSGILVKLLETKRAILPVNQDHPDFFIQMSSAWNTLQSVNQTDSIEEIKQHPSYQDLKSFFSEAWGVYIKALEWRNYYKLLSEDISYPSSILGVENYYDENYEFSICPRDIKSFCMVGCGPYPETILKARIFFENLQKLYAIDSDIDALNAARALAEKKQTRDISFFSNFSHDFDYSDLDLILLANGLKNKENTLRRIERTAKEGTYVLLRKPVLLADLLYEDIIAENISYNYRRLSTVSPSTLSETILYRLEF